MAYRYFIKLAYNGSAYGGWQNQPNTSTVQQWIENGLLLITGAKGVVGCGRTDAGVHAANFYAHFDHENAFTATEIRQLKNKLNGYLPQDIVVFDILPVQPGAHARYSALWRQYEYVVIRQKDPFTYNKAYLVHGEIDVVAMNKAALMLRGRHNFQSFSKVHTQVNNYFCTVQFVEWSENDHVLKFTIRADRFLRNMVRAVVGTLLDVGKGKLNIIDFQQIIESRNRSSAGYSVPAKGLTLSDVGFPAEIFVEKPIFFEAGESRNILSHYYTNPEQAIDEEI